MLLTLETCATVIGVRTGIQHPTFCEAPPLRSYILLAENLAYREYIGLKRMIYLKSYVHMRV